MAFKIAGRGLTPVAVAPIIVGPLVIQPQANGAIILSAATATLHGSSPQVETKGGTDDIGYWGDANDSVSWEFSVPESGPYDVSVDYSCDDAAAGESFRIEVGDQSLTRTTVFYGRLGHLCQPNAGAAGDPASRQTHSDLQAAGHTALERAQPAFRDTDKIE